MALETISTAVSHDTVQQYLLKLDERGETYGFNVTSPAVVGRGKFGPLVLSLHRDGHEDALELTLQTDGTWHASHVIVVGDK